MYRCEGMTLVEIGSRLGVSGPMARKYLMRAIVFCDQYLERAVDLVAGQALFCVAKEVRRAFVVDSDGARVRALGTQFDLYRKHEGTVITVIQGQVSIEVERLAGQSAHRQGSEAGGPTPAVLVSAGEQAVASSRSPVHPYPANVTDATAWTKGMLVFDSIPLSEAVAEFNRIGVRRLVVEDRERRSRPCRHLDRKTTSQIARLPQSPREPP